MSRISRDPLSPPGGWRSITNPRLLPIKRNKAGIFLRSFLWIIEKFSKIDASNLWLLLRNNPRLMHGLLFYVSKFMPFGDLKRADTELVILRVAWNCRTQYVWGQHVQLGMRTGLSVEDIIRISKGPEAEGWKSHQKTLLNACDEFHRNRFVSDSTWGYLSCHYDKKILLELLLLIGFYEGFGGVLNSAGLPLESTTSTNLTSLESSHNFERDLL
jgi:alkylhydroperoxidase family enzyme